APMSASCARSRSARRRCSRRSTIPACSGRSCSASSSSATCRTDSPWPAARSSPAAASTWPCGSGAWDASLCPPQRRADRPCGPERPEYHLGLVVAVDGRRRLGGDAPVLEVAQHQGAVALGRVAEAAAAGGLDDDDVTLPHHYVRRRRDGDRLVAA